jgi:ATP-binding cassette subfamily B protein
MYVSRTDNAPGWRCRDAAGAHRHRDDVVIGGQDVIAGRTSAASWRRSLMFIVAGSVGSIVEVAAICSAAGATERWSSCCPRPVRWTIQPIRHGRCRRTGRFEFEGVEFVYPTRPSVGGAEAGLVPGRSRRYCRIGGSSGRARQRCSIWLNVSTILPAAASSSTVSICGGRARDVRRQIGFVPQDPVLFAGSVLDNLRYGCQTPTSQR